MFQQVDDAFESLLRSEALGDAPVTISFDAPSRPWIGAVQGPTVNVFLYDVRENSSRRDVMLELVLDDNGAVVGRRAPARRYDLAYLVSVWAPTPALEHHIFAALVAGLSRHDVFPKDHVPAEYRELGLFHLTVASGMKRMMPGNFAGEMKLQLEVMVTVPLPARVDMPVAAPVEQPMDVRVSGAGGQQEAVRGRSAPPPVPRQAGAPTTAGADPARSREQVAGAVARGAAAAGPPAAGGRPPAGGRPQATGGAPAAGQARPAGQRPAAGRPVDPMATLRSALAQAAQAQAALAQAQAAIAHAMAGGPRTQPPARPGAQRPGTPPAQQPGTAAPPGPARQRPPAEQPETPAPAPDGPRRRAKRQPAPEEPPPARRARARRAPTPPPPVEGD